MQLVALTIFVALYGNGESWKMEKHFLQFSLELCMLHAYIYSRSIRDTLNIYIYMTFKFEFLNFSLVILIFKASIVARVNCQIENVAIKNQTWVTLHTAETHCIWRILYEEKILLKREISLVFLYQNNFIECQSTIKYIFTKFACLYLWKLLNTS